MSGKRLCLMVFSALFWAPHLFAFVAPEEGKVVPNFDIRKQITLSPKAPALIQLEALKKLQTLAGEEVQVRWDELTGTPRNIFSFSNRLTPPSHEDPVAIALNFLRTYADLFLFTQDDIEGLVLEKNYKTAHNNINHLLFHQYYKGIPIFYGEVRVNIDNEGQIINVGGNIYPGIELDTTPNIDAIGALKLAAESIGRPFRSFILQIAPPQGPSMETHFARGHFQGGIYKDIPVSLTIFPMAQGARLAWKIILEPPGYPALYEILVSAATGETLFRQNLMQYLAQGLVFEEHPDAGGQVIKSFEGDAVDSAKNASPQGWVSAGQALSLGNNVLASLDWDNTNNQMGRKADGGLEIHFEFPFTNTWENSGGTQIGDEYAAITNLFWMNNFMHDYLWLLGFNEPAGNFQNDNFGRGGDGNDRVNADCQDGFNTGQRNNANFATPPDGISPRMQMYLFTSPPLRNTDGDFDGDVIIHEYSHGLSNRLVGGRLDVGCLGDTQSGAMGEGWSDFMAVSIYNDGVMGEYVTGNSIKGIRRYPYSTDMATNPLTYANLCRGSRGCEVHDDGEIWAVALWEARAVLINAYGQTNGKSLIEQLVVDGMKVSICNPSMLDARDAILLADIVNNNGANFCLLYKAFAKRGMGASATSGNGSDPSPIASFDVPPECIFNLPFKLLRRPTGGAPIEMSRPAPKSVIQRIE